MSLNTDREKCAHLLRRFGLGASEAELDYYLQDGLNGAIDRLLAYEDVDEDFNIGYEDLVNDQKLVPMPLLVLWWVYRLTVTRRPLQEKMTFFWHDHFATSAEKVKLSALMYQQNETLRQNATGNFKTLLTQVSKDPAMLFWLDNQYNVKGKANENFARELMELFTLGVDNGYTEEDIQEAARAFTGWTFRRLRRADIQRRGAGEFLLRRRFHDYGEKHIFGQSGNFGGEDVITMLCEMPETSEYIVKKIWEWFVYSNPSEELIQIHAKRFRDANLDIHALLKNIMRSSEFYSEKAERSIYKSPIDFVIVTQRQLGIGEYIKNERRARDIPMPRRLFVFRASSTAMNSMGMQPLFPPDVAGWDGGRAWISTATMVERIAWADKLFGQSQQRRQSLPYDGFALFGANTSPETVAQKLVSIYDAPLPIERMRQLVEAANKASGGEVNRSNAGKTCAAVSKLIFATPEFQFC